MNAIKERIVGAITVMPDEHATQIWEIIEHEFMDRKSWSDIPETEPDEWDMEMISNIKNDPDCKEFISQEELHKEFHL